MKFLPGTNKLTMQLRLLSLLFLIIGTSVNGQVLIDTGKVWNVVECLNFGPCVTFQYRIEGDTTIGSNQYKILMMNDSGSAAIISPYMAREDSIAKQVYFNYDGIDYLVYDFALNQGDTFNTIYNGIPNCPVQMIVDAVDSVTLSNGELRKRLFLSGIYYDTWIAGIGSLYGPTYMGLFYCISDLFPELNCFTENDTLKYVSVNYPSCFYNTLGTEEISIKSGFDIVPNPMISGTTIHFSGNPNASKSVRILNVLGQTVLKYKNIPGDKLQIERGGLTPGLYFVLLTIESEIPLARKLVVR